MHRAFLIVCLAMTFVLDAEAAKNKAQADDSLELPSLDEISRIKRRSTRKGGRRRVVKEPTSLPAVAGPSGTTGKSVAASQPSEGPQIIEEIVEAVSPFEESEPILQAPQKADRFQLSGWVRQMNVASLRAPKPWTNTAVPLRRFGSRNQMFVRLQYARGDAFEAVAAGAFTLDLDVDEPNAAAPPGWPRRLRESFEADIREAYVGAFVGPIDIRVGQQRIAWGKGDLFAPNDVVNPLDNRDPLLSETELLRVPLFLARMDIDVGIGSIQLLYAPFFVPNRFDFYGTPWALIQEPAPQPYRAVFGQALRRGDVATPSPFRLAVPTRTPTFKDGQAGARFVFSIGDFDFGLYYHYGFDGQPRVAPDRETLRQLFSIGDYDRLDPGTLNRLIPTNATSALEITYARRHHAGLDFGTLIGPIALRLDAMFEDNKGFVDRYYSVVARPILQTVLSVEYQTGDFNKALLFELSYMRILGAPIPPLFFFEQNNVGFAAIGRWLIADRLELELRALLSLYPFSMMARPQIGVKLSPRWYLRVGAQVVWGVPGTQGDYFKDNMGAYLSVKCLL